eukprot:1108000-Prymnesium_polylepis.1
MQAKKAVAAAPAPSNPGLTLGAVVNVARRTGGGNIEPDVPLMEAGIDSLGAVELRNQLQAAVGEGTLPSTLVFDHPTARQLASFLQSIQITEVAEDLESDAMDGAPMSAAATVAVDGTSAVFPAGAGTLKAASLLVATGSNVIGEVPLSRWDVRAAHANLPESIARRACFTGFMKGAQLVDNAAFAVSASEAAAMDPCQRLLLEHGYQALHDALFDRTTLNGSLTGVFLGFVTDFDQMLRQSPAGSSVYAATGSAASIAAGRL